MSSPTSIQHTYDAKLKDAVDGTITTGNFSDENTSSSTTSKSLVYKVNHTYQNNRRVFLITAVFLVVGLIAIGIGVGMNALSSRKDDTNTGPPQVQEDYTEPRITDAPTFSPTLGPASWELDFLDLETIFSDVGFGNDRGQIRVQYLAHLRDVEVNIFQNDCSSPLSNPSDVLVQTEMDPQPDKSKGILSVYLKVKSDSQVWVSDPNSFDSTVQFCIRTELVMQVEGETWGVNFKETKVNVNVRFNPNGDFTVNVPVGN
mmetsp:Transcript_27029/g.38061  ORF Transcript_27029/g.38061 Transcript_27029/m.38061 type:complete len:259 (+) Transcript_27029:353-1129(+)